MPDNRSQDAAEAMEDRALVRAAKSGDQQSLETLIRRHQTWIFNLAARMVWG